MDDVTALTTHLRASERLLVLTGAGISTLSGIPDYRDDEGEWKHAHPVLYQDFMRSHPVRQRYWARSMLGWGYFSGAHPNDAHHSLARLERTGQIDMLVTQNVDGLHQRAGSRRVIDLHGQLDTAVCQSCGHTVCRRELQVRLQHGNPGWVTGNSTPLRPDGDVDLEADFRDFRVPDCDRCGGILKPDVVFYGESVPRHRVEQTGRALQRCDALLVVGSSLMVRSGLRFVEKAAQRGVPRLLINRGRTRADELFTVRVRGCCRDVLGEITATLQ